MDTCKGGGGVLFFLFFFQILMGYDVAEATGLGFVCFVVINPGVLSVNRVDSSFFVS